MQTRIELSALNLASPMPDTYITAIPDHRAYSPLYVRTTELEAEWSGQRRGHARTVRPAWYLVINYPRSVFVPVLSLTELVPSLDTTIRTKEGSCTYNTSCLVFGDIQRCMCTTLDVYNETHCRYWIFTLMDTDTQRHRRTQTQTDTHIHTL